MLVAVLHCELCQPSLLGVLLNGLSPDEANHLCTSGSKNNSSSFLGRSALSAFIVARRKSSAEMRRVLFGSVQDGTLPTRTVAGYVDMVPRVPLRVPTPRLREGYVGHVDITFCLCGRKCGPKNAAQTVCPSDAKRSSSWWRKTCGTAGMKKD